MRILSIGWIGELVGGYSLLQLGAKGEQLMAEVLHPGLCGISNILQTTDEVARLDLLGTDLSLSNRLSQLNESEAMCASPPCI